MGKHRKRKEDLDRELSKLRRKIEKLEEKTKGSSRSRSPRKHHHTRSPRTYSRTRSRSPHAFSHSALEQAHTNDHSDNPDTQVLVAPPDTIPSATVALPEPEAHGSEQNDIDADILAAMGSVEEETVVGPPAHNEIAQRWMPILTKGLKKDEKAVLLKEYTPFNNIPAMVPPKLNPELTAAVSEQVKKRDNIIEYRQKNVAAALAAIGSGLECFLTKGDKVDGIKKINDASKILCDIIHNETVSRRSLIQVVINKELKDSLQGGPDEYLFGTDLTERIRTTKAVQKSAQDLTKLTVPKPPTHPKALNSRVPLQPRYKRPGFNRVKNENHNGGGGKKTSYTQKNSKTRQPPRQQRERSYNRRK